MYDPSFSGSIDPVTRLVAHVPIKFIVGALVAKRPQDDVEPFETHDGQLR
jgi:hypothetical protein